MSPDLRHATVFVKPLLGQDEEAVLKALRQNTAFLQREVAHRVRVKYAAKLKFIADESFDEGGHIDRLLRVREGRPGLRQRMIDLERLAAPMAGEIAAPSSIPKSTTMRSRPPAPRIGEIWQIYANNFGPDGFD